MEHEHSTSDYGYNRSYEWPWDSTIESPPLEDLVVVNSELYPLNPLHNCLRLVVLSSRVLPKARVAVADGYSEIQLGRDEPISDTVARIRLKDMEVSKIHSTIYWDPSEGWSIVDMGSKHGTFLRSNAGTVKTMEFRLSISKTASIPKRLCHLDLLILGTTTFVVHIHENRLPCGECSPGAGEEIPLFATRSQPLSYTKLAQNLDSSSIHDSLKPRMQNSKMALSQLKNSLLSKHTSQHTQASNSQYVDRSARRRALYPASSFDAPGISDASQFLPPSQQFLPHTIPEPVSKPVVPIPIANIGHSIMVKQGWHPGSALGERGLVEPLNPKVRTDRSGLGSSRMATVVETAQYSIDATHAPDSQQRPYPFR